MSLSNINPLRVGITGGIGSGKSTVGRIFSSLGVPVYEADARARSLMNTHPDIIKEVIALLGEEAYTPEGLLNRAWVGKQVFQDPHKLSQLNRIVHPRTGADFEQWANHPQQRNTWNFVLKEAAILYESGASTQTDKVVMVYAPKQLRLQRVLKRDPLTPEEVITRMERQWPETQKLLRADRWIINDGYHMLIPQVIAVAEWLKTFSSHRTGINSQASGG